MAISEYWVGQIPSRPIAIHVKDTYGNSVNLSAFVDVKVRLVGSDDESIDLTGAVLTTSGATDGRVLFRWPTDRSLFDKSGEYLLQLEIDGVSTKDFTDAHTIRVRRLGGKN